MNFKAVIFDIDNTLFHRTNAQNMVAKNIFKNHRDLFKGRSFKIVKKAFWKSAEMADIKFKNISQEAFRKGRSALFLEYLKIDPKYIDFFSDLYLNYYSTTNAPYLGVKRVINKLWNKYSLAVISNGYPDVQYGKLESLGLSGKFDIISLSFELDFAKPDKRIFDYTLDKLDVNPQDAIYIGDSLNDDIFGANNAGLTSCLFDPENKFDQSKSDIKPDFTINKLSELLKFL